MPRPDGARSRRREQVTRRLQARRRGSPQLGQLAQSPRRSRRTRAARHAANGDVARRITAYRSLRTMRRRHEPAVQRGERSARAGARRPRRRRDRAQIRKYFGAGLRYEGAPEHQQTTTPMRDTSSNLGKGRAGGSNAPAAAGGKKPDNAQDHVAARLRRDKPSLRNARQSRPEAPWPRAARRRTLPIA